MIVMKFGGTSTEDAAAMRNVLRIVQTHLQSKPVLVISAIARATNELEQIARSASLGQKDAASDLLNSLRRRHEAIIGEVIPTQDVREDLLIAIERYADAIAARCEMIRGNGPLRAQDMDAVCSFGERMSSRIVAAVLSEHGVTSRWVDVCEFMTTDDRFGRARPLAGEAGAKAVSVLGSLVERGVVPVTQGFIGVTAAGEYTTMGRESSDYSATVIGSFLGAERVQIWTDVDGILSADPRTVPGARSIRSLSFQEALHLSAAGAKVLHPVSVLPVMAEKIPVQILNSKRDGSGSVIEPESRPAAKLVKSIAHRKNQRLLSVTLRPGCTTSDLFAVLAERGVTTLCAEVALNVVTAVIDRTGGSDDLSAPLGPLGALEVRDDLGSVTLVGTGAGSDTGFRRAVSAAAGNPEPLMVVAGGDTSLTLIVENGHVNELVQKLHAAFVDGVDDPGTFPV